MSESPVSPVMAVESEPEPRKIRLDDEQIETLSDALKVAAASMRGAALLSESLGDTFIAGLAEGRAERFEQLLVLGQGVTRVTVRF